MRKTMCFVVSVLAGCSLVSLTGCASMQEVGRGIAGTSTKILEEKRADASKKEFNGDYQTVRLRVNESLKKTGCYVYRESPDKGLIAVYLSKVDTTPVGVFISGLGSSGTTLVEISSPSEYAKEYLLGKIAGDLKDLVKAEKKEVTQEQGQTDEKK